MLSSRHFVRNPTRYRTEEKSGFVALETGFPVVTIRYVGRTVDSKIGNSAVALTGAVNVLYRRRQDI